MAMKMHHCDDSGHVVLNKEENTEWETAK